VEQLRQQRKKESCKQPRQRKEGAVELKICVLRFQQENYQPKGEWPAMKIMIWL
jgi:hypothetical protein